MVSLPMYDQHGKEVGSYDIDPQQIAERISKQLLHDAVVMYQANQRQGTRQTKTRAEVSGSTKKMYRQKGTGRARAGGKRTNIRRGGGHAFALRTRDYSYRLPRKALRLATRMAIAGKIQDQQVAVIDQLAMSAPKTKPIASMLRSMGLEGVTTLIATEQYDQNLHRSARNIAGVEVAPVHDLNAWVVLRPGRVVFTRAALDKLRGE
ncbi:MAG TPA: 50S ribosomal protein L4 [Pirellulaceae bacterium]|nr:50S ribosomal protein L4 [Pirellulaceae bacterium]